MNGDCDMNEIVSKIVWWEQKDFTMNDPICDYCGEPITHYPCPVKQGNYALCNQCRNNSGIYPGHTEYFETMAYNMDREPKRLGVNCGGR